jgi:cyclopropane fatty-acyl-phospholipid synthase-like methyltransferase
VDARSWLARVVSIEEVATRLDRPGGAKVAAIGCGFGAALVAIARLYPRCRFLGFDAHAEEVAVASELAAAHGLADRVGFEIGQPGDYSGNGYDLVAQLGAPGGVVEAAAARHVRRTLAPDGSWIIVAPDAVEAGLRARALAGGFTRFRRAGDLPFVFEVRA